MVGKTQGGVALAKSHFIDEETKAQLDDTRSGLSSLQNYLFSYTECQVSSSPGGRKSGNMVVNTQDSARPGGKDLCQTCLIPSIIPSVYLVAGCSRTLRGLVSRKFTGMCPQGEFRGVWGWREEGGGEREQLGGSMPDSPTRQRLQSGPGVVLRWDEKAAAGP